jgi:PAS domain S-box-containing protein
MPETAGNSEFRALLERAPDPVAIHRGDRFVFANDAMARYLGYEDGGLDGTAISDFIARHVPEPESAEKAAKWFVEGDAVHELVLVRRDGGSVATECRAERLTFGGAPARALFLRDVSERARAWEALRRSEQNFRTIIERSPIPMCVSRTDRLVYVNPALLGYLGYDLGETMVGPTLAELSDELIHPEDRERTRSAFGHLFAQLVGLARGVEPPHEVVRIDDVRLRSKRDGSLRFCDMHGVVVMHDGSPALVTYLHDHTERRAAADRVRLADRMSSLGTLSAGIAHEINNPLTYAIGNVELVATRLARTRDERSTDLAAALRDARIGLDRIRRTVRALKTFSRPDEESVGPVDVVAVLESCIEMAQSHLRHRGRLVRDYSGVSRVRGNDARIAQVFLNLLVNAAQANLWERARGSACSCATGSSRRSAGRSRSKAPWEPAPPYACASPERRRSRKQESRYRSPPCRGARASSSSTMSRSCLKSSPGSSSMNTTFARSPTGVRQWISSSAESHSTSCSAI